MREDSSGRNTVPPWGQPHDAVDTQPASAPCYAVGNRVCGAIDGCPGTVVSVDEQFGTCVVKWDVGDFPIVYPMDTVMIRKAMPWE